MALRLTEWIAVSYFLYLSAIAPFAPVSLRRRILVVLSAVMTLAAVALLSRYQQGWGRMLRDWAPLLYILVGYWLPGLLVSEPAPAFERRLAAFDARWLGGAELRQVRRIPRFAAQLLELAYLFCYPVLPAGYVYVVLAGTSGDADRYWTAVVLAAILCYGVLPWLPTRPPRVLEVSPVRPSCIRLLNLWVIGRASVQLNTFPSGHVATATAVALSVAVASPVVGALFGLLALSIAAASVAGRYHYLADALAGIGVALAAFAISRVGG